MPIVLVSVTNLKLLVHFRMRGQEMKFSQYLIRNAGKMEKQVSKGHGKCGTF